MVALLLLYFLGCYGITTIVVQSKMFKPFREFFKERSKWFYSLFNCMLCCGFWVGLISTWVLGFSPCATLFFSSGQNVGIIKFLYFMIFDASAAAGLIWLLHTAQLFLEKKSGEEL